MNIKITNKDGLTLHTAHKYCKEDILVTVDESLLESSGSGTLPTLFAPTIRVVDNNLHINDLSNGDFTESYDIYSNDTFLINTENEVLDLSAYISVEGTYSISIIAKSTNFNNSSKSNALDYIYTLELYVSTLEVTLPSKRGYTSTAVVGNSAYIIGGLYYENYTDALDQIIKFDMENETITTFSAKLPSTRAWAGAAAVGTNVYIFGGRLNTYTKSDIVKFDTTTREVTTLSTTLPKEMCQMSAAAVGTNVYLFGGHYRDMSGMGTYNDILKFDTTTETIETLSATLPSKRCDTSAVAVGTNIYIFGGSTADTNSNEILKFDTTTETLTTLSAKLPTGKNSTSAVAVGTNIYIFGGSSESTGNKEIYKFDTLTETIETLSITLNYSYDGMSAAALERKAYLFGGTTNGSKLIQKVINL